MVGKRAVHILLEYILVTNVSTTSDAGSSLVFIMDVKGDQTDSIHSIHSSGDKVHLKAVAIQTKFLSWLEILAFSRIILLTQGLLSLPSLT